MLSPILRIRQYQIIHLVILRYCTLVYCSQIVSSSTGRSCALQIRPENCLALQFPIIPLPFYERQESLLSNLFTVPTMTATHAPPEAPPNTFAKNICASEE